jgi:glycogen debranching enzyme
MARLGEVPFRRSYGTVDASPLYVMLAGKYFERTGDLATIEEIWPSIEAALQWWINMAIGMGTASSSTIAKLTRD